MPASSPSLPRPFYHDIQRSHIKALALFVPKRDSISGEMEALGAQGKSCLSFPR